MRLALFFLALCFITGSVLAQEPVPTYTFEYNGQKITSITPQEEYIRKAEQQRIQRETLGKEIFEDERIRKLKTEYKQCRTTNDCIAIRGLCCDWHALNRASQQTVERVIEELRKITMCLAIACNPSPPDAQCAEGLCETISRMPGRN